jgi:serine/threonine protein kinase
MASSLDEVEKRIRRLERLMVGGYGFSSAKSFLKKAKECLIKDDVEGCLSMLKKAEESVEREKKILSQLENLPASDRRSMEIRQKILSLIKEGDLDSAEDLVEDLRQIGIRFPERRLVLMVKLPPELSARYEDEGCIGGGGFAYVFRARRRSDGMHVAVKVPFRLDEFSGKMFINELANWTNLIHKNIVRVYDYNIFPVPYIEMELCDCSLADIKKPVDPDHAVSLISGIADGLIHAHSRGIFHRDLKPHNILLKDNIPKISDWGLSKVAGKSGSLSGFTVEYAAPEQILGERTDNRTDIWQLGVIFYELITGELPFKGDYEEIRRGIIGSQPPPPSKLSVVKGFDKVVMKCLEKDPERRYQSVEDMKRDLAEIMRS